MTLRAKYWCPHSLVVTVDGPQGPRTTTVDKPFARLSARRSAEIVLPDLRIASRGLYLHATDAGVFCLGFSHAEAAEEPWHGWLQRGETAGFGPYQVSARLAGPPASPEGAAPPGRDLTEKGTAGEPCPIIAVAFGDREVARRRLSRALTVVGRLRPAALPIHSSDLSASHLVFYWDAGTLWVIDLLSRLGTSLEGIPVQCAELPLGCSLTVGEVRLTFAGLFSSRRGGRADLPVAPPAEAPAPTGDKPVLEPLVAAQQEPPPDAEPVDRAPTGLAEPPPPEPHPQAEREVSRPAEPSPPEPSWRAELEARQRAIREEPDAWAAQQRQRELQWRERTVELAERQAALAAEQHRQRMALDKERRAAQQQIADWTASMERLRADLARQRSALEAEQEQSRRRQKEVHEREVQWESEEARRLEAARREEELLRGVRAEREALEAQFHQQRASLERLRTEVERQQAELRLQRTLAAEDKPRSDRAEVLEALPASSAQIVPAAPIEHPVPKVAAGPGDAAPSGRKEFDAAYEEVLDRLMLVSRRRSSRLHRLWEACGALWKRVARRGTAPPPQEPPDRDPCSID